MSCVLGLVSLVLKVVFFPFTIYSAVSTAKIKRKMERIKKEREEDVKNQGRMDRFYKVKFDKFFNYRDYNSNKDLYVGNGMYLYMVDAFMLPEEASEKGYLTEEEALVEYNKKMVEICKILNLPIPLV